MKTKRTGLSYGKSIVFLLACLFAIANTKIALAQPPDWNAVMQAYFTKYQPADTPAWVFPIVFKDGYNERDTVYLGYDISATNSFDNKFGEGFEEVDTSKFTVSFRYIGTSEDTTMKYSIMNLTNTGISTYFGTSIDFHKGIIPLTMYWKDSLFYSDSLPFPDLSPAPLAKGIIFCIDAYPQYGNCPVDNYIALTDTASPFEVGWVYSDSIVFNGAPLGEIAVSIQSIRILPWDDQILTIGKDKPIIHDIFIYPNPSDRFLNIISENDEFFTYAIYDVMMRKIALMDNFSKTKETQVNIEHIKEGIYFLRLENAKRTEIPVFIKFVVIH